MHEAIPIKAELLSPMYYHGIYIPDGSATHPNIITDTALVFALHHTLMGRPFVRPDSTYPDYLGDLKKIPWRASLLMGKTNQMLAGIRHTVDVEREGGYQDQLQKGMGSGNYKKQFFVNEVAIGAKYTGLLYGPNPFKATGQTELIIRVGVGKTGLLKLTEKIDVTQFCLNCATAKLFDPKPSLKEAYRILDTIRVSQPLSLESSQAILEKWIVSVQ